MERSSSCIDSGKAKHYCFIGLKKGREFFTQLGEFHVTVFYKQPIAVASLTLIQR